LFRRLGAQVTIVQSGAQLLAREDADVAEEVARILREDGIEVKRNARAEKVGKVGEKIAVTVRDAAGTRNIEGTHLLVAIGRSPNSDWLNLTAAGIAADKHDYIQVNER